MRFDYFENLWNAFKASFEVMNITKEKAKAIYDANFSTLRQVGEGEVEYLGYAIQYTDMSATEFPQAYVTGYTAFKEGRIYLLPINNADVSDKKGKAIVFGSNKIRFISTSGMGLLVEDYYYNDNSLTTRVYDESVLNFIKDRGITFNSIDFIEEYLASDHLIPDVTVRIGKSKAAMALGIGAKSYEASVENVDGNYSCSLDFFSDNPNYAALREATRHEMNKMNGISK